MGDVGGALDMQHLVLAETLGLAMARKAADILDRHRAALAAASGSTGAAEVDDQQFAVDNAIFTAVLDATNECLGEFDARPADDRWCDALLQVIQLAQAAKISAVPVPMPRGPAEPSLPSPSQCSLPAACPRVIGIPGALPGRLGHHASARLPGGRSSQGGNDSAARRARKAP